jgi:8-oxo-dGTP pyrophosphatase MutT (NUDIX family)
VADAPLPSSTVVVLREGAASLEVLLLQRAARHDGGPGPWVFPGGKVEAADTPHHGDEAPGVRRAAVRETREEAGLVLAPEDLVPVSRWITPEISPRRFDTWFYAVGAPADARVRVDGREIVDHRWLDAESALAAHAEGTVRLAPPTFVTVHWLRGHRQVGEALEALSQPPFLTFRPRLCPAEDGVFMLYPGDAGYETGDPGLPGARHRIRSGPSGFEYVREGV